MHDKVSEEVLLFFGHCHDLRMLVLKVIAIIILGISY